MFHIIINESFNMTNKEDLKVPNLERGLKVLELMSRHPEGMILSTISSELVIPKNSSSRIMNALTVLGFVTKNEKERTFRLTNKLLHLGSSVINDKNIVEEAIDIMRDLRDLTGETVLLETVLDNEGVVLANAPSLHPIRLVVDEGTKFPLHSTASGKLVLGMMSDKERKRVIAEIELTKYTDNTICTSEELHTECERIREQGYSVDDAEGIDGAFCIAAPITRENGDHVASIVVTGPSSRMKAENLTEFSAKVVESAKLIGARL
jgi:DNA-binding IclR family transcriptional regulator